MPGSYETWFNKGIILFNLMRFEEAATAFDRAINLDNRAFDACYYKGLVRFQS